LLPIATLIYSAIAAPYPYYATWDSSHIYTLDAIIVGAGQLPDHLFHPNMIPLVLDRLVFLPIGKALGLISVSSIEQLETLPNPYLPFAETAQFLIALEMIFALVFLVFMCLVLSDLLAPYSKRLTGISAGLFALTMTALALTWRYLPYMLVWVRYETVGLALWSVALFMTLRAAREPGRIRFVIAAGVFSGSAVFCKVQLIGGVAVLPFLFGFLMDEALPPPTARARRSAIVLAIGVFVLLASIHGSAYAAFANRALPGFAFFSYLKTNHFVPIAPICALFFCLAIIGAMKIAIRHPASASVGVLLSQFVAAFCLPLLFALCLGTTWQERTAALQVTYIYSFMFGQFSQSEATGHIKPNMWSESAGLYIVIAAVSIIIVVSRIHAKDRLSFQKLFAGVSAAAVAVFAVIALVRPEVRKDGMMHDAWLTLAAVVAWRLLLPMLPEKRLLFVGAAAAWLAIGFQIHGLSQFSEENYRSGSREYNINKWKETNYGFRGALYRKLMRKAYTTEAAWSAASQWSDKISEIKLLLVQSFHEMDVHLSDMMLAVEKGRFGSRGTQKIANIAPELSGALVVLLQGGATRISVRPDMNFYLVVDGDPKELDGKSTIVPLAFNTAVKNKIRKYTVYALAPGDITVDPGDATAAILFRPSIL
jgi:ABC-2 type transport system permease protein